MDDCNCVNRVLGGLAGSSSEADVITNNGYHICGRIVEWDSRSILMDVQGAQQLVFLHNVSTIIPLK